jgi:hypothetical protein
MRKVFRVARAMRRPTGNGRRVLRAMGQGGGKVAQFVGNDALDDEGRATSDEGDTAFVGERRVTGTKSQATAATSRRSDGERSGGRSVK